MSKRLFVSLSLLLLVHGNSLAAKTKTAPASKISKVIKRIDKVESVRLKIELDHPNAVYKTGETVRFTITASRGKHPLPDGLFSYVIDDFRPKPIQSGKLLHATTPQAVSIKASSTPGFLQCKVIYRPKIGKTITMTAVAAIAPLSIQPSLETPKDFDQFWTAQKKKLAAVPMTSKLTPVKFPQKTIEVFDAQITALGKPVSGIFCKAEECKTEKFANCPLGARGRSTTFKNCKCSIRGKKRNALDGHQRARHRQWEAETVLQ